ncbi:MAG: ABC transporter permease subunit [Nitrososphaera sp.]|nr:ABC transporter permease subunit [Nitrososphaera sp.]
MIPVGVQKALTVLGLLVIWEAIAWLQLFPALVMPSMSSTTFWLFNHSGEVLTATLFTLEMLGKSMAMSMSIAFLLAVLSASSPRARVSIDALISVCNPIPGLALIPFAILWFGFTPAAIIFIVTYSSLWALTINITTGFTTIRKTILEVGRNFGLSVPRYVIDILVPAALPSIISGVRIGWALSWRSVVGVELVFGAVGQVLGLGATIYTQQFLLESSGIMGILLVIAMIGFGVENVLFSALNRYTVIRWGMQSSNP